MASGERTQSDVESDEEFEEMTSDAELWEFYFEGFDVDAVRQTLKLQMTKRRLDRVEKILEILFADRSRRLSSKFQALYTILWDSFKHVPIGESSEFILRIFFRYANEHGLPLSSSMTTFAVKQAVRHKDNRSLDALREILGDHFVNHAVEQERVRSRSELLSASLRGDLAEVDRLLVEGGSTRPGWCGFESLLSSDGDDLDPIAAAAELGHTAIVERLLVSSKRDSHCLAFGEARLWNIACQRSNLAMAANLFSRTDITWFLKAGLECVLFVSTSGTPEFFRGALSMITARLGEAGHKLNLDWLSKMLDYTILHRRRHHVTILLDEIDQDRNPFFEHPRIIQSILFSRSAVILRDVLIRYPEDPGNNTDWDPILAIEDYHWPAGARLLVEAGAKIRGKIPPKFVGLLSLSLEDRCRIAVRRYMKLPLSRSVARLPLPKKVKARLLYCWAENRK